MIPFGYSSRAAATLFNRTKKSSAFNSAARQLQPAAHHRLFVVSAASNNKQVLLVESPAKAKKIQGYLGDEYKVIASYGHIRDLPPRPGSVVPEDGLYFYFHRFFVYNIRYTNELYLHIFIN